MELIISKYKYILHEKGELKVKKTKSGAPYETPRLDVLLIERADIVTASGDCAIDGDYDEGGWT